MKVYLIRHGDYSNRKLNDLGKEQMHVAASELKRELNDLESITVYHSPALRAVQSAQVLAEELAPIQATTIIRHDLDCDSFGVRRVVRALSEPAILVSHGPDLEDYMQRHHESRMYFSKGEWVSVDIDPQGK